MTCPGTSFPRFVSDNPQKSIRIGSLPEARGRFSLWESVRFATFDAPDIIAPASPLST